MFLKRVQRRRDGGFRLARSTREALVSPEARTVVIGSSLRYLFKQGSARALNKLHSLTGTNTKYSVLHGARCLQVAKVVEPIEDVPGEACQQRIAGHVSAGRVEEEKTRKMKGRTDDLRLQYMVR